MPTPAPMRLILGGPSYQMQVDARHAGVMAALAIRAREIGRLAWVQFAWVHGCPVERARNEIFLRALDSDATHLLTVDSDCYWRPDEADGVLWILEQLSMERPIIGAPVAQRNGISNVVTHRVGARWERLRGTFPLAAELHECVAIGTGLCAYFLPWYRAKWPQGPHFRHEWQRGEEVSEDFWHCRGVATRLAPIHYAPIVRVIHAARGLSPVDEESP